MIDHRARAGFTLVELLIALAILGIVTAVAPLAFRVSPSTGGSDIVAQSLAARRLALRDGRSVTIDVVTPVGVRTVTAYPDASIVADSVTAIDRVDVAEPKRRQ